MVQEQTHAKDMEEERKQKLLQLSEISLWLDSYDDIFSDFDPRPYSQRSLSDDFLIEAKKAAKEKVSGMVEMKFLIPNNQRNLETENVIKKRLHTHFKKHYKILQDEVSGIIQRGVVYFFIGMVLMLTATYFGTLIDRGFVFRFAFVLFEPGGWFIMWFGLDKVFYEIRQNKSDLEFYEKMSKCDITFLPY
jgi:hypothetical protein